MLVCDTGSPGVFFFESRLFISWHYLPSQPDLIFLFHLAKILLTVERQKSLPCTRDAGGDADVGTEQAKSTPQTQREWGSSNLGIIFSSVLLAKASLLALNLLQTHTVYAHTFLGHAIRPEKIAFSLRTAAGRRPGKSCALTDARALQPPEKLQSSLFF